MSQNNNCQRCNEVETTKHMLWECADAKNIWETFNIILRERNLHNETVNDYSDLYKTNINSAITISKIKLVQCMIQIDRPKGWTKPKVHEVIREIYRFEKYNSVSNGNTLQIERIWKGLVS